MFSDDNDDRHQHQALDDAKNALDGHTTVDLSHEGHELHDILMGSFEDEDFVTTG